MHYYQFNIGDYRKDTAHLSVVEHYIYRQLIDWYYLDEKPIPLKTQSVIRRLSLGDNALEELQNVLGDFFEKDKTGYVHSKIEKEIEKYHAKVKINQENGKRGGRPIGAKDKAKRKQRKTQSVNSGNPEEPNRNPNQEPITNNHKPETIVKTKSVVVLPDWINQELWDGFMEIRKGLRAKNTDVAIKALLNKLSEFKDAGLDPNEAISNSIESSWKGVFEPKHQNGAKKFNLTEALKNDMQRITEREVGDGPVCEVAGYLHGQVG